MRLLPARNWLTKYSPESGDLVADFYIPALECAVRYDRSTGYFSAYALALAARGIEGLVRNQGRMRIVVGCTLKPQDVAAIQQGADLRDRVEAVLLAEPLCSDDATAVDALGLLAWMVAKGYLDVKVAVPCDEDRKPIAGLGLFHEKAGILEDAAGNRLAFSGSINETEAGWKHNWDSFHVFTTWGGSTAHVQAEEDSFQRLWADKTATAIVMDVPAAVRLELLKFLPKDDLPGRLRTKSADAVPPVEPTAPIAGLPSPEPQSDPRRLVWGYIRHAPAWPDGGERVGEATSAVIPWPHQVRAFQRLYAHWPPRLLIADEVGLGKTIQAGLLLRQAWLAGRAKRILVLAPKAVLRQWQIELREKFNLNWPIYDGQRLCRYPSRGLQGEAQRPVDAKAWHREPCVLVSSHLMRRRDRAAELLSGAEPWDLVVLDEAHHARRGGGGLGADQRPNQLLRLMQSLRERTQGLVLLTATPMQVSPVEVWDLMALLGLPADWHLRAFLDFFEYAAAPNPSHAQLRRMADLFQAAEVTYGALGEEDAMRHLPDLSRLKVRKILRALRDTASIPLKQLETSERQAAVRLMKLHTPLRALISRHTRELLRRYREAGKLKALIATRKVEDRFVEMTPAERLVYEQVEDYIGSTYDNAAADERTAVGFVMTIYRRRLASSFHALTRTLEGRLAAVGDQMTQGSAQGPARAVDEDVPDDELGEEEIDAEEAVDLERQALDLEEMGDIRALLAAAKRLPSDTKAGVLLDVLTELREQGYRQAMIFTQYTDTMDFLRGRIADTFGPGVICFSGRGGEILTPAGDWHLITREATKKRFRDGLAEIMVCTDAAAEGLNFQFCGALVNYDMPWNPMRVEQRIGRIDRLGQEHPEIRIVNLHYQDTVEADVYDALRHRINLFQSFVGRLQPILARLPRAITEVALGRPEDRERARANLVTDIASEVESAEQAGFDLDEVTADDLDAPERPPARYDLADLGALLARPELLPPGVQTKVVGARDWSWQAPGMPAPVRVTTDPDFYEQHPDSTELWSPGSPVFPVPEAVAESQELEGVDYRSLVAGKSATSSPTDR
ncbi:MAG: helicase [Gammaproteobacteria bacterium]|jgi:superfamily II DNA or RNA helicase|nr:helicase [Gammaproteobacteria bacterium]